MPAIKKLEHAMEDQIYLVLRKNRIISKSRLFFNLVFQPSLQNVSISNLEFYTNSYFFVVNLLITTNFSMNSLFAIPANQEFVFIPTSKDSVRDWRTELIDSVINLCNNPSAAAESLEELSFHSPSYINEMNATSMCGSLPHIYSLFYLNF